MTVLTATKARATLYTLIDEVSQHSEPVYIKGKRHSAVLVSEEDWNAMRETLYLLSIPQMRESIIEGMNTSVDECSDTLDW